MSQRLLKALGCTTAIAVLTAVLGLAPAQARDPEPRTVTVAHVAVTARLDGHDHFTSSANVDVPPGGTATVTSPTVDPSMKQAKVEVSTSSSDPVFDQLAFMLAELPTPGKRLIACLLAAFKAFDLNDSAIDGIADASSDAGDTHFLIIYFCLAVAQIVSTLVASAGGGARVARAAAPGCAMAPLGIKTKKEKTSSGYTMSATRKITKKKKNSKLKVKCVVQGNKNIYTIKPRKKGKSLRSVVGKNLVVGIGSPSDAEHSVPVKVAFKAP